MSMQRNLVIHSQVLSNIIQLKKGKRSLLNATLYRFKRSFEKFQFGNLSAWHEMESLKSELEIIQKKFKVAKKNIIELSKLDVELLKKYKMDVRSQNKYTIHSLLDTVFLDCLEHMDEVFALLELILIQPNISNQEALRKLKYSLKQYCLKTLITYVYQPRKPAFYLGNYCQAQSSVRKVMLKRIDITPEQFTQMVSENSVGLLSDTSRDKLLQSSQL